MCRITPCLLLVLGFICCAASPLPAQFTLTAGSDEGVPGTVVDVPVLLDNESEIYGFSMGITHDDSLLTLDDITQGAAISDSNGGAGADFFDIELTPDGGSGGTVGCIISTDTPLETLAVGTDQELVVLHYSIQQGAETGVAATIDFTNDLGSPKIRTIVSDGTSYVPSLEAGEVEILTPPVADLACSLLDPCDCVALLTWSNPSSYDSISITRDGVAIATLAGSATSYEAAMASSGTEEFAVIPTENSQTAEASVCSVECPADPAAPESPTGFACELLADCEVSMTWSNSGTYDSLELTLDGVVVQSLGGDAEGATLTLEDTEEHEICLGGTLCDVSFESVCCGVQCATDDPHFKRGDVDGNGAVSPLSDGIRLLNWGFTGGATPPCMDSADVNDNGTVQPLNDTIRLLNWGFIGGAIPPSPGPTTCGADPTDDSTGCATEATVCQ